MKPGYGVRRGAGVTSPGGLVSKGLLFMAKYGISPAKFWGVTLAVAVVGFALFKPIFIDNIPAGLPEAKGAQAGFLMFESALSSIAMGIGVAMLIFGGNVVRALPVHLQLKGRIVQVALFWGMAPWLVHTGLHITNREGDFGRLIGIEYGFHVTTYAAAIICMFALVRILQALVTDKDAAATV